MWWCKRGKENTSSRYSKVGGFCGFAFVGERRAFTVLQIFRNFLATKLSVPSGPNQLDFYLMQLKNAI